VCVDQAAHGFVEKLIDLVLVGEAGTLDGNLRCRGSIQLEELNFVFQKPLKECVPGIFVVIRKCQVSGGPLDKPSLGTHPSEDW
jgi:hypothetical protein